VAAAPLALHECRLEHPLRLASIAARCGVLKVPEDRSRPGGATIDLSVAVVPALNRRAAAAPLFLLAGGPGQSATVLVTFATMGSSPIHTSMGNDSNVPPPATALTSEDFPTFGRPMIATLGSFASAFIATLEN